MTELLPSSVESDTVASLLRDLQVTSTVYCRSDLSAPWGFGVRARELASFHVVAAGDCWLSVEGDGESRQLGAGDLAILPGGHEHSLRDSPESPILWLEDLLARHPVDEELRMRCGGGGERTELLCGGFALEGSRLHPALSALPVVVHVRGGNGHPPPWLAATLELIALETNGPGPGAAAVVERLSEVMLAQALRIALLDLQNSEGVNLEVLGEAGIAPAVRAIHERPEFAWTLGELAALASMSRSAFAARFRTLTGDSPIRYVTRCRLIRAARRLRTSDAPLTEIADLAGYESEFSFSRAFKRAFGVAPGVYRSQDQGPVALEQFRPVKRADA
jgi:AraC-like DNA-binding protein